MNLPAALLATVALLAGNAFFVASEFALVAARRTRLERASTRGSRAARTAVAAIDELSLMLAGAQLGITMCSLGLGAVTEPAFEHLLDPLLGAVAAPAPVRHAVAFTVALGVVTFLHMVVGEMAPKSWAITHPERSALVLATPFRGFTALSRPLLAALNAATNALLRLARVRPRAASDAHPDPQRLAHLITESRRLGLIDGSDHDLLKRAITIQQATIAHLVVPAAEVTTVPCGATPAEIRRASAATGHTRLPVRGPDGTISGLVHARDALPHRASAPGPGQPTAAELAFPIPSLSARTGVLAAITTLRHAHAQLAVITAADGGFAGIVSLDDLLSDLLTANPH
ncbi:MAG TPA: hemolysin family protein [Streptosporangiaceae bacterium]